MIRKVNERNCSSAKLFDAPGEVYFQHILNKGEFSDKGRLFSHVILHPGCGIGKHTHKGDFEVYYILKGEGVYDDNGTEVILGPGDTSLCLPGESHALINKSSEDLELIALILFS